MEIAKVSEECVEKTEIDQNLISGFEISLFVGLYKNKFINNYSYDTTGLLVPHANCQ